jgi:hypothetical protein
MDKVIGGQWADGLLSGEFEQGQSWLASAAIPDEGDEGQELLWKHCCLGVLCEQAVRAGVVESRVEQTSQGPVKFFYDPATGRGDSMMLPVKVQEWAGLDSNDPEVNTNGEDTVSLSYCNDTRGDDFTEIAGYVRQLY